MSLVKTDPKMNPYQTHILGTNLVICNQVDEQGNIIEGIPESRMESPLLKCVGSSANGPCIKVKSKG